MKKNTLLGILGTLLLGALGSGLWELIKPGFSFVGSTALTIVSLGMDSIVSDIYTRVGRTYLASAYIKGATLLIISMAVVVAASVTVLREGTPSNNESSRQGSVWSALFLLVIGSYLAIGALRHTYVGTTRAYFEYLTRASAPYLTADQRLMIDSRLALVTSKADYDKLVVELKTILKTNNISVEAE